MNKTLAQRVKDSGWQCPVWAKNLICWPSKDGASWELEMDRGYCAWLRPDSLLASVVTTEKDSGAHVRLYSDGYPIVEEENQ